MLPKCLIVNKNVTDLLYTAKNDIVYIATKIANLQQVAATLLIAAATSNIKGNLGTSSRNVYEEFQPNPMITFV